MIDFRYYIVTITAIFLALGIGVVTGATVLDRVTVDALHRQLDGLREDLNNARADIKTLRQERGDANDLVDALAPRVTQGLLAAVPVLLVRGETSARWEGKINDAIRGAGATESGTIVLTKKWTLQTPEAEEDLRLAFGSTTLSDKDPIGSAAKALGKMLSDPGAAGFVKRLGDAGFLRNSAANGADPFPLPGVRVVVFALPEDGWASAFALGSAASAPTLVVAPSVEELGAVGTLRAENGLPPSLATFDSGTDDRAGLAAVLAFRAAIDDNGGHFGRGRGLRFLPAPT